MRSGPPWPCTYRLGVSGLGRYRLVVDGAEVFDATLTVPEGADPAEVLMAPPQQLAPVELAAGQSVAAVFDHDVYSSPFGGFGTVVQLSLEPPHGTDDEEIAAATSLAAASDVAVVVVGTTAEVESEGFDRTSLSLPGRQDELVRRVIAANPRTVVVVNWAPPSCCPGPRTRPRYCCPGSAARSSATRSPTSCSATPSQAGGCL